LVVIVDHYAILKGTGVSSAKFWWDCGLIFDEVAAGIFSCAPTPAIERLAAPFRPENLSPVQSL
jgi:hypothetical protein